jgi:23S rRNA pseudoU1915 N3-methylase RlmH
VHGVERIENAEAVATHIEEALDADPHPPTDADEQERVQATRGAATRLKEFLKRTPTEFIPPMWFDGIEASFNQAAAEAESYTSNPEPSPFPVSWQRVNEMWHALTPFLAAIPPADTVTEDAATFRRSAGQLIRRLTDEVTETKNQLEPVRARLEDLDQQRAVAVDGLNNRMANFEATINEQTSRLEEAIRANQVQFSEAQERRNTDFSQMLDERRAAFDAAVTENQVNLNLAVESIKTEAAEDLEAIEDMQRKATESYSALGTATIAGYYQKDANDQNEAANTWRLIATGALAMVVLALIAEFFLVSEGDFSLETTLARLPVALAFAALAAFAGQESRRHRRNERWSREREVEVSSIDPYLVLVSDEDSRDEIKLGFARRIFWEQRQPDDEPPQQAPEA